jgi:AbrB family looped-hinge helix DNA binding protein
MQTKVSSKGQVVLPGPIRRKLGIRAGDPLEAQVESGRIILTPTVKRAAKPKIVRDPLTGFPVLTLGKDAPVLTTREVREILADFP